MQGMHCSTLATTLISCKRKENGSPSPCPRSGAVRYNGQQPAPTLIGAGRYSLWQKAIDNIKGQEEEEKKLCGFAAAVHPDKCCILSLTNDDCEGSLYKRLLIFCTSGGQYQIAFKLPVN
eukprot:1138678-Pelagomonas_calceolata.AAC.16